MVQSLSHQREGEGIADAQLAAIVDSSFDAIIGKTLDSVITSWNVAAERLFGYSSGEAIGRSITMLIPDNRQAEETAIIERIRRGERVETFETIRVRKDGKLIPVSITVSPIRNVAGTIVGASKIARDISDSKESERRIRNLMREVNHRVKNQFAVIVSMVRETAKRAADPKEFERDIRERIAALAKSHDLLVTSDWSGASLSDLINEHLKPFGHEQRIHMSGPPLTLTANAVQYIGMALHELATNSAKYGALSGVSGRLAIEWHLMTSDAGSKELNLSWEETSPPRNTSENEKTGFGTIVLKRIAPQSVSGSAVLERAPGSVRWLLTAPAAYALSRDILEDDEASIDDV